MYDIVQTEKYATASLEYGVFIKRLCDVYYIYENIIITLSHIILFLLPLSFIGKFSFTVEKA